jgi:hypothetical protein
VPRKGVRDAVEDFMGMTTNANAAPSLSYFANAIREVLGLDPLPGTVDNRLPTEIERFAHERSWPLDAGGRVTRKRAAS